MSELFSRIISQMGTLSTQERAELAYLFLRSLEPEDQDVDDAWAEELNRRVEEIQSGKAVGTSAAQLFAELGER